MNLTPQLLMRWAVGIIVAVVIGSVLWYFRSIVIYILVSGILAIMGRPMVRAVANIRVGRWQVRRWMAALLTLICMWVVMISVCSIIVPLVINEIYELASLDLKSALSDIQEPLERVQEYLSTMFVLPESQVSLSEILIRSLRNILDYDTINSAFSSIIDLGISAFVVFFSVSFITFFFMKEDGLFYAMMTAVFPDRYKGNVTRALDKITVLLSRYFTGLLTESFILMIIISLTMIAFGMRTEDACFIAITMGVMNVIPYAGPLMGGIASIFIGIVNPIDGYTIGHTISIIVFSLLVIKCIDDFILQPTIYSERVKAHPLEIFIVILLAGSIGGIVGMLLAIPSYTVLRVFAKEFFSQFTLVQKLTEKV